MRGFFFCLVFFFCCGSVVGQRFAVYRFDRNVNELNEQFPALTVIGKKGHFIEDQLPGLRNMKKVAYRFYRNSGLCFDNAAAGNLLSGSYTVEMYFRFDRLDSLKRVLDFKNGKSDAGAYILNGRINFYRLMVSEEMIAGEEEYIHWVISRDAGTKLVSVYANGKEQMRFQDYGELARIDENNRLIFFYDDLPGSGHTSSGAVAYIKLYDHVLSPEQVSKSFNELGYNMQSVRAHALPDSLSKPLKLISSLDSLAGKAPEAGTRVVLQNINFQPGKYDLLPESFSELDKLVQLMEENPDVEIFLSGHTDYPGDAPENILLSEKRVEAVKAYLVKKGIADARITGKGYGGTQPVADFDSEESRKLNRRVEFTILKNQH